MVNRGEETQELLVHEVEVGEPGIAQRGQHVPGRGDRQQQWRPPGRQAARQAAPLPRAGEPDHGDQAGQCDPDQALGERRHRRRRVHAREPPAPAPRVLLADGEEKRQQHRPERHRHRHVEHQHRREDVVERRSREHQRRQQPGSPAEQAQSGEIDQGATTQPEEPGPQPQRPLVHPERGDRRRGQPVHQGRLLEVLDAVEARRHPIAGRRHLARDLGVARFVGFVERTVPGRKDEEDTCGDEHETQIAQSRTSRQTGSRRGHGGGIIGQIGRAANAPGWRRQYLWRDLWGDPRQVAPHRARIFPTHSRDQAPRSCESTRQADQHRR